MPAKGLDRAKMAEAVVQFLESAGLDISDPQLRETPERVAEAWTNDFLDGYAKSPQAILATGFPAPESGDMVVVTDLRFHSMCPHHLLPYVGRAHIAYLPGRMIIGFGQVSALLDCFAHRLTLQEDLAKSVAGALTTVLKSKGAACVIEAEQACLRARGKAQREAKTTSQAFEGLFRKDKDLRREFWSHLEAAR